MEWSHRYFDRKSSEHANRETHHDRAKVRRHHFLKRTRGRQRPKLAEIHASG